VKRIAGVLLASLAMLAGCSDGYEICSAPIAENCREFRSEAHYKRWVKEQNRRQLIAAQHFPDDYRDVVAATLKELLQSNESEFPNARRQFFASVFGEDADATLLAKLQQLGVQTQPGSRMPDEAVIKDSQGGYIENYQVYVSDVRRLASGVYRVEAGYYCGPRCAGHLAYRLRKEGNVWVFTSTKGLMFS